MKIEFPSHFPHGLCRVQDIAISDLAPHALRTSSNRLSCRSCRQPSTAKCAQQPPHDSDSHTKTRRMIRTGMAHLAATPPGGHIHGSSLRSRLKTVFSTRAARLGTLRSGLAPDRHVTAARDEKGAAFQPADRDSNSRPALTYTACDPAGVARSPRNTAPRDPWAALGPAPIRRRALIAWSRTWSGARRRETPGSPPGSGSPSCPGP